MRMPQSPPPFKECMEAIRTYFDVIDRESDEREKFNKLIEDCNKKYRPWNKVRIIARQYGFDPKLIWGMISLGRTQLSKKLPLFGFNGKPLRYVVTDDIQQALMQIDQELAGRVVMRASNPMDVIDPDRYIANAINEEAIASSMLEGAVTTRKIAKEMLRTKREPKDPGEQMVVNNYRAIEFIRENTDSPLSEEFLFEVQRILTEGTLEEQSAVGRYRRIDEDIKVVDDRDGEVIHVPPSADELPERINALCRFANDEVEIDHFLHPVIKACVLHFQLGFDHPFCDGNGRTARAIFYWSMLRDKYWLFEYLPISRLIYRGQSKYIRAFLYSELEDFDVTYFLRYKKKIITWAKNELHEYISRKHDEFLKLRKKFQSDGRLNYRQRELLGKIAKKQTGLIAIKAYQGQFRVSYQTARQDLLDLVEWGYLIKLKAGRQWMFAAAK